MSKNLIPEITQMLGVEIGEKFKIKGDDELTYKFDSDGLKITHYSGIEISQISANVAFVDLVNGKDEIVKLPWKPKHNERYWTFDIVGFGNTLRVVRYTWDGDFNELTKLKVGWVYCTRAEAEAALPKVAAEMGVDYEL